MHQEKDRELRRLMAILFSDEELLKECIEDVSEDIKSREELARKLLANVEKNKKKVEPLLDEAKTWAPGYKPSINGRRTNLERMLLDLKREERLQLLNLFRNKTLLKKELRDLLLKYKEASRLKELLEKLGDYDEGYR